MTLAQERKLWKRGYRCVAGVDEVGRGALAGPVCAAAVGLLTKSKMRKCGVKSKINPDAFGSGLQPERRRNQKSKFKNTRLNELLPIKDSKQLTAARREQWYDMLTNHPCITWSCALVSEKIIDKIGIDKAVWLAMERAVLKLKINPVRDPMPKALRLLSSSVASADVCQPAEYVVSQGKCRNRLRSQTVATGASALIAPLSELSSPSSPDFLLIDGNRFSSAKIKRERYKLIVKGDEKVFLIAAASVIAKVTRDRLMTKLSQQHPHYGFWKHKGYGTREHVAALQRYGVSKIHRKSFLCYN